MPRSLKKVQKHIAAKKGNTNSLIEGSRDARSLQRASLREGKLSKMSAARTKLNQPKLTRTIYFRDVANLHNPVTIDIISEAINDYINRNNDEISRVKSERRPGRPPSTKEDLLNNMKKQEEDEYTSGFEIPNLLDATNVERLKEWNGHWSSLMSRVKFVRVDREGSVVDVKS